MDKGNIPQMLQEGERVQAWKRCEETQRTEGVTAGEFSFLIKTWGSGTGGHNGAADETTGCSNEKCLI